MSTADRFVEVKDTTARELDYLQELDDYYANSLGSNSEKLRNFAKYVQRQALTRFVSRYEIFKKVLNVQGSIVECGVLFGGGLMTFAQLSAIFEPVNYQRQIVGFDTFAGFSEMHAVDQRSSSALAHESGLAVDSYQDLAEAIRLYDMNRFLSHLPKVQMVRGDARETIPQYLKENPHLVVSLLYLDFDIYEPTKVALEYLLPRVPRGGIIAFDELNSGNWPGETVALAETIGLSSLKIERFSFDSFLSFAVIG